MRFLQLITTQNLSAPPAPEHVATMRKAIDEAISAGAMIATGALGKRTTSAARIIKRGSESSVEDPPSGEGWMAAGGYSLCEFPGKAEAIAQAKLVLQTTGDAVLELIQVSEMYPPVQRAAPQPRAASELPAGVVPYLTLDDASAAAAFYQKAFGAIEIARMPGQDGKRLMHCQLEINGGAFMLSDNFPEFGLPPVQRSPSYTMQLVVADGDAWWKRAREAGCIEKLPFAVAPWGDKYGQLLDPFGVRWALSTPAANL